MERPLTRKAGTTRTIESLPKEIAIDILSRLPTPSLLNSKLVCKSWRILAQDPLLVDLHFGRETDNNHHPCLILHSDHPLKNQLHALYLYPHSNNNQAGLVKKIHVPMLPEFDVAGSCNGWLCLFDFLHKNTFYMYNPFTSSCMELPVAISTNPSDVWTVIGFGFHSVTNKYKVLKISPIPRPNVRARRYHGSSSRSQVDILTVGSHDWRSLGETAYYPIQYSSSQVCIMGKLHWVNWPVRYNPRRKLISFDLEDEKFRQVPKPDSADTKWGGYTLLALRGCLSAAVYRNYGSFEVWIMKDYGVKESWIREFSIGVYVPEALKQKLDPSFRVSKFFKRSFTRVIGGLKNGEILLEYKRRVLVSYNPTCGVFKDIAIPGTPCWFESVVHVGGLDRIDTIFGI